MSTFRSAVVTALDELARLDVTDLDARSRVASALSTVLDADPPPPDATVGGKALARRAAQLLASGGAIDAAAVARLLTAARPPEPATTPAPDPTPAPAAATPAPAPVEVPPAATPAADAPRALPRFVLAEGDIESVREFVTEAAEYLSGAEAALLTLEDRPEDAEAISAVFRAFHTIKGVASFMTLLPITEVAHHAETLLGRIRSGELRCVGANAELAFQSLDLLRSMFAILSTAEGGELALPATYAAVMARLCDPELGRVESPPPVVASTSPTVASPTLDGTARLAAAMAEAPSPPKAEPTSVVAAPVVERPAAPTSVQASEPRPTEAPAGDPKGNDAKAKRADVDATIRVRTDRLDRLIDMVGELVIAQAMLWEDELLRGTGSLLLQNKVSQATKIVRELHDSTLSLRMVPLRATFQKVARVARDVSHRVGKPVQVVVEGDDTEIDRNTVELLADPLIHMVRNAIDHGIEDADVRASRGKGPAVLAVRAFRAGSDVVIEVEDDGKGIDPATIFRKAVEKGLVSPDTVLTEAATLALIFEPGFSTREQVTEISGRGVGMDVVKRAVDALKGTIGIGSTVGRGTRFTIRLPLTLAMTDGLLVRCGGHRYVIPLASISESVRPTDDVLTTVAERGEFVSARGELIPIVRLASLFGLEGRPLQQGILVILATGNHRFAVLVDELLGQQQVVAKSLGPLGANPTIAGGAILGDGRVGLILDPGGLFASAKRSGREPSRPMAA